ncbi:MAG TPA: efflux RND transporter periplasmic adaptor subunit [Candidatus Acidoferrales bacterium]|nr:efflux RND transporter periplasmic adaptor subunit [Candidatus Acidoferrales bacterium]
MPVPEYLKSHKKAVAILVIAGVVVILTGMIMSRKNDKASYMTAAVQRGNITAIVQATGTINPLTTAPVGSYVSGNVKYIFADFNTHVRAGEVLAQIDPALYEAQVETAQGNLASARANLENLEASLVAMQAGVASDQANVNKAKADLDYTTVNAKRTQDLFQQGILSHDQNDLAQSTLGQKQATLVGAEAAVNQAKAQIQQIEAQINQAKAQVRAAQGTLQQQETNLRYTTILSPIDGVVTARNITVGQAVASSLQAQTLFSVAQDLTRMQVYAQVDESDTGNITVGTPCTFQVDAFPTEIFHGRVNSTRLNPTLVQNVVTYSVVIDFENPEEKLLPGETAYVTIPTGHASNALEVPNSALIFTPSQPPATIQKLYADYHVPRQAYTTHLGGWQVVWKLTTQNGNQQVAPVAIRAGISDFNHTQVLEGELNVGDTVITGQTTAGAAAQGQRRPTGPGARIGR